MLKGSVLVLKLNDVSSLHENIKNGHIIEDSLKDFDR